MELFSTLIETLILLCISCLCNCEYVKNWNKCPVQSVAERLMPGISVHECLKHCYIRTHCQLICYRTASHMCEIYDTWNKISKCTRCMTVFRGDIPGDQFGPSCECEAGQTCNTLTGQCEYTECQHFDYDQRHIYGNLAYIGAKVRTRCNIEFTSEYTDVLCNSKGIWSNKITCKDFCPLVGDLVTVTEEFRISIFDQDIAQLDAKNNCSAIGYSLFKVDQTHKLEAFREITATCPEYRGKGYWVDGYSETPTDITTWKFSDGMPIPTDIWGQEPYSNMTQCTRLKSFREFGYMLHARRCDKLFRYICEAL